MGFELHDRYVCTYVLVQMYKNEFETNENKFLPRIKLNDIILQSLTIDSYSNDCLCSLFSNLFCTRLLPLMASGTVVQHIRMC